ncbi:MAG: hypothetical protein KF795_05685 [Labilithrix sp.]|nr:hypothetical protein [Labilithrix sp.]
MRGRRGEALALALLTVSAAGLGVVQPRLARDVAAVRERDEVFALPPAEQLRAMTFGYRHAAADLIWAKMLVEHGLHWQEKRKLKALPSYIDAIIALEPDHPVLYQFVDTLIVFQPGAPTPDDARLARGYLERGTRERPYDAEIWLHYGQYLAYLAPSLLTDNAEIERWRTDGARALMHAVELGADADRSLAASTILTKSGERKATIEHLRRAYALTDDHETRRQIALKLERLNAGTDAADAVARVESEWQTRYPFLSRGTMLLIGPHRTPDACAGPHQEAKSGCPRDWTDATRDAR